MPFIDDAPAAGLPLLSPAPLEITPPPLPFSRLFDSAMRRENIVGSITEAATQPSMGAFDPSFDPWAKIEGYEDHARSFIGANNDDDILHIKARIDKERRDEEALSTGGWRGMLAQLAAGTLDPTNLIPAGGQIGAITRGGRALEGLVRGGAAFGAGSALQEIGLQGSQITRPVSESLLNIGSGAVLGGVLGGAVGGLTRPTKQLLRDLGDSSAVGGLVFDRELAANLPGRRPTEDAAEIIDAPTVERAIADEFAAGGNPAKIYEGLGARIERELADGVGVARVDQGGERVPIIAIDKAGVLTDANGVRLRLDEVTAPGHSIEIEARPPEARPPLVDDPLALHQRGELTAARAEEISTLPPEEVARLRAAGVPVDPEMWKVIADNLGKAEASREGGVGVVVDQMQYMPADGVPKTASEREAVAVIARTLDAEAARGGDVGSFLADADAAYRAAGRGTPPDLSAAEEAARAAAPAAPLEGGIAGAEYRKLTAAGVPEEEARLQGELLQARYQARSAAYPELGSAEALYRRFAPDVVTAEPTPLKRRGVRSEPSEIEPSLRQAGDNLRVQAQQHIEEQLRAHEALAERGAARSGEPGAAAEPRPGGEPAAGEPGATAPGAATPELEQAGRGKIRLGTEDAKALITRYRDAADASTLIHEDFHQWTRELFDDAARPGAPPQIVADAATLRRAVGAAEGRPLTIEQLEQLAQWGEQYLREGKAPTPDLQGVFDRFKAWLTEIYQTIKDLGVPISDEVRGVYDRMLAVPEREAPVPPTPTTGGSVGAAKVLDTSLDQETIASALGVEKALVRSSPTLRAGTSPLIDTRRIAHELADQPLDLKKNIEGTPTAQSVESLIKQFRAPLAEAEVGVDDAFVRYRLGRAKRRFDIARLEARDMFGRPQGAMSYGEFREAISRAMRRGDQSTEPEVTAAAKLLREKVFDPLKERAIAAGLLPEDVDAKTALSYLMRLYDTNKIVAQRGQFSDVITRWLSGEQAKKDTIRTRVTDLLDEHRDLTGRVRKREAQIEGRERTLRDTEREMRSRGGPARGGAVFETAIRRRGNVLADQAAGRRAAIERLGERTAGYQERIAAIQTELEDLVKSWEGATSQRAKAALASRAEAEATRTPEQGRLRSADKPVIKAAKAMAGANTRLEEIELRDIARQIIDRIIGSPVGRLPYDMGVPAPRGGPPPPDRAAPRGPLAQRAFMIPDELIEPWLENDSRQIARSYNRTMAPDVLLAERFGRTDMQAQLQQIQAGYERLRVGKSEVEQKKLNAAMQADLRDLAAMRDRLRGTYGLPENPNGLGNRVYHVVRDLNYLRLLGGMTISAFPDMGRLVMTHGLTRTFGDAIVPMLKDFHEFKMAAKEAKLAGTALDMVLDTRAMSMADMLDDYGRWSKYERGLKGLTDKFGLVSLMAPWNAAMKQIAGVIGQTRTLEVIEDLVAGRAVRPAEQTRLASLGIGSDMAERIDAMFKAHGAKQDNGTWWANTEAWTDRGAIEAFRSALNKEIDTTIVTQGQEVPLWMSRGVGRMIGQFKTFSLASAQRVMMTGLQKRDMATLNGAVMMIGLGMMVYAIRTALNPKAQPLPDPTTPGGMARWIREGVDISGLTGWLFDVHNMVEKATGGGIGLSRLTGGSMQSRYANRNTLESILGPTSGLVQDAGQLIGAATKGEWSAGDSSRVRRMIPFQNLIGMRHLFDAAEHGLNHSLGIREPAPPR